MSDDYFSDVPFVTTKRGVAPQDKGSPKLSEIAAGSFWTLAHNSGEYVLEYTSGEIEGRARSIIVTAAEADNLRKGDDAIASEIIIKHGGG